MMLNPSEQWFSWILQIMGKEKGLKYMRELSQLNLTIRSESAAMRVDLIAAGEAALDIDSTYGAVNLLKKRGAPIDWTTLGPVLVNLTGHGVAVRAPHPNAAKLFVDFILSQEGQGHVLSIDRWIIRSDLFSEQAAIKDLKLIPVNPALGENMEYYARQSREIFSK
jgi:iron(III) transport system substrate-binding protein